MENNEVIILELESGRLKIPNMFKLLVPGIGILMNITLVTTASFTIGRVLPYYTLQHC